MSRKSAAAAAAAVAATKKEEAPSPTAAAAAAPTGPEEEEKEVNWEERTLKIENMTCCFVASNDCIGELVPQSGDMKCKIDEHCLYTLVRFLKYNLLVYSFDNIMFMHGTII